MHPDQPSKKPERRGAPLATFAGLAAVLGLAGAAAWAAIPDRSGVIHACYNNSTGALRVVDTTLRPISRQPCAAGETALSWNQSGSSAVSVHRTDTGPISSPGAPWVPIITASGVPAGTYMAVAKTRIDDPETFGGDCQLVANPGSGQVVADEASQSPYKTSAAALATYNLEALIRLTSPGTVQLQCRIGGPTARNWYARRSKLILVRLNSATDAEVAG